MSRTTRLLGNDSYDMGASEGQDSRIGYSWPSPSSLINLGSLAVIQISNAVSPLIIYPFALATVGSDGYSQIAIAESLTLFLSTFVLYSFEIDGVAAVVNVDPEKNNEELSQAFWDITLIRCTFYFLGTWVLATIVYFTKPTLLLLTLEWSLASLALAIQPNWLYQGLERNFPLALTTAASRAGVVVTILLFVHKPEDYWLVPGIIGCWYLVGAAVAAGYSIWIFKLKFALPHISRLGHRVWHGKEIFLGNIGVSLYRDVNVLLLGIFGVPSTNIAAYSLAEKLVKAIQASTRPLNQFFFPRALAIAKSASAPSPVVFQRILRITIPQWLVVAVIILCLVTGYLILDKTLPTIGHFDNANVVFGLASAMSIAALAGLANFMFGSAGLNALGARRYLFLAILGVGVVSLMIGIIIIPLIGSSGAAVSFVFSELFLFVLIARRYFRA
jgi:PST family polysaccharide transporter